MFEGTELHDTDEPRIRFEVEVSLPAEQARAYLDAMTGNDDDILLAAETAMRERLGRTVLAPEVELSYADWDVRAEVEQEADQNARREQLYGPTIA